MQAGLSSEPGAKALGDGERDGVGHLGLTAGEARRVFSVVATFAAILATLALLQLAARAALRLEPRWDTFAYHLPYAAVWGGLPIPYEMNDQMKAPFDGYPPLPHLLQGALWRLTGSMNATGVVNYLAFGAFLAYAHAVLRAPYWLVALASLSAPLVIIHACSSYVDLFGNSFLAIGACSCASLYLFPERARRAVVFGAPLALAAAAWSKYLLVPLAGAFFLVLVVLLLRRPRVAGMPRATVGAYCAAVALLAAAPYLKNLAFYHNPFWPLRVPLVGDWFPFTNDAIGATTAAARSAAAEGSSPGSPFLRSLFELGLPTHYSNRARWIIDQGSTSQLAFRLGGFWSVAVVAYSLIVSGLLVRVHGKRGGVMAAAGLALIAFWALLPQAHELRYYLFVPLTGAGCVGMLLPSFARAAPRRAAALLALCTGLFVHMVIENREHYRIERLDERAAARHWEADDWWPKLRSGRTYCAIGMVPMALLLTGPTLSEFQIVDRTHQRDCPRGSVVLRGPRASR